MPIITPESIYIKSSFKLRVRVLTAAGSVVGTIAVAIECIAVSVVGRQATAVQSGHGTQPESSLQHSHSAIFS